MLAAFKRAQQAPEAGFTLLEVLVSIAILAMGFMVLLDSQGGSVKMTLYAKNLTVATQLARAKIAQLQQQIEDKKLRFGLDKSVCKDGDFNEEGSEFKKFKWKYCIKKVEFATPDQLPGLGGGGGGGDGEGGGEKGGQAQAMMAALGIPSTGSDASSVASGIGSALGPFMGILKSQMKVIFEQLQESLREIQVTISWKDGREPDKLSITTHIFHFNRATGLPDGWPAQNPNQATQ
tara:strand:+ start:2058 stop:2762 length:705 start_codon:yes stop_codon:yes gene_type:complete